MKKIIKKAGLLTLLVMALFGLLAWLSAKEPFEPYITQITNSLAYKDKLNASKEVEVYIDKAAMPNDSTKLIIGDSVCNSLFGELDKLNPDYTILCANKGITMAGQYILAKTFLDSHENVTDLYLIMISNSLITGFDTDFGYQYAVMPFVKTDTISMLDDDTILQMKKLYYSPFLTKTMVGAVEESPFIKKMYLNALKEWKPTKLTLSYPDVTTRYFQKIYDLCQKKGVTMHFFSPPLADSEQRREIENTLEKEYNNSVMYEYFPDYYKNYIYYPKEWFPDGIHPNVDRKEKNKMIRHMEEMGVMEWDLRLE